MGSVVAKALLKHELLLGPMRRSSQIFQWFECPDWLDQSTECKPLEIVLGDGRILISEDI